MSPSIGIAVNSNQALYGSRPVCPTAKLRARLRAPKSPCDEGRNVVPSRLGVLRCGERPIRIYKTIASGSTKRDNLALLHPTVQNRSDTGVRSTVPGRRTGSLYGAIPPQLAKKFLLEKFLRLPASPYLKAQAEALFAHSRTTNPHREFALHVEIPKIGMELDLLNGFILRTAITNDKLNTCSVSRFPA